MRCTKEDLRLYVVTDRAWLHGQTLLGQVEQAILGGVTMVQLREKELGDAPFKEEALLIQALCKKYKVPFIINDNVYLAKEIDADGVHVGQGDMKAAEVRKIMGAQKIIGVSAKTAGQAIQAEQEGADYIGCGAVFATGTKKDASVISHDALKAVSTAVAVPVVAIGGITKENLPQLEGSHISGVAVVSAIFAQPDIKAAANTLRQLVDRYIKEPETPQ